VIFTAADLANGPHTLTIQVTGEKTPASTNTYVVVDAFDVPAPTITRFQEIDRAVSYSAGWTQDITGDWSQGSAAVTTTPGAQATFTFTGTSVSWIAFRGPMGGIARVLLDGVHVGDVDLFSSSLETEIFVFTARDLADTIHALTIEATGQKNPSSTDVSVAIDAFEVTSSSPQVAVSRFQETHPSLAFTDGWGLDSSPRWSSGAAAFSGTAGAAATFTFTGKTVSWIGFRGPQTGIARVMLDGGFQADVDTFSTTDEEQAVVFTSTGLSSGTHVLRIEVTRSKNAASSGTFIVIDALDVTN